jgi:hypothetical protein
LEQHGWQRSGEIVDVNDRKPAQPGRQMPGFVVIRNPEGSLKSDFTLCVRMQIWERKVKCIVLKFWFWGRKALPVAIADLANNPEEA